MRHLSPEWQHALSSATRGTSSGADELILTIINGVEGWWCAGTANGFGLDLERVMMLLTML